MGIDTAHRPDQCSEDEKYVDRRKHSIPKPKLQRRERKIEDEVEYER
jgi:hypothetical protein